MIGREYEIKRLKDSLKSNSSELIAVYGRRRIGKTYLIRNTYENDIRFEVTGLYRGNKESQLGIFLLELKKCSKRFHNIQKLQSWEQAFEMLKMYINGLRGTKKKVIFIDEFPWLDSHKSGFLMYFGHFWNTFCEKRKDLTVVICGSAASYMLHHIVSNKGSLHARLNYKIQLEPFNLNEVKQFLLSKNINWSHYNIVQLYIALGGIPHYINKIKKGESLVQNIQRLCFNQNGDLTNEFNEIFESLFDHSDTHKQMVRTLGISQKGITRNELINKTRLSGGGHFTKTLDELMASGFVRSYAPVGKKKKLILYRLSDEYSKFYIKYIESNKNQGQFFWKTMSQQQSYLSWAGFNFETICLKHIPQIKKALGIEGIHSRNSSWSSEEAQIDLVIERNDKWINLFEIKFHDSEFVIDKRYAENLRNKIRVFKSNTKTKHTVVLSMLTTYGISQNEYSHELIEDNLTIDPLFES